MKRLHDRVIIVTGGAQGIGRVYCERLAHEGARLVVADLDGARAERTATELRDHDAEAAAIEVDVTDPEATERLARKTIDRFGRIDALINNAGMWQRPSVSRLPFEEIPLDEWDRVMNVNLRGVFLCSRAVVPHMKRQQRGKIVNVSSGTVFVGTTKYAHYVASKAAVIGLTRVQARELGDFNIQVNAVAPGLVQSLEEPDEPLVRWHESAAQVRAIKRVQTPQDVVGTVVFLCSEDSDFITGQTIVIDGGAVLH